MPGILTSGNEHHGSRLGDVAVNRDSAAKGLKTGDIAAGVIYGQVKAAQKCLRPQSRPFEGGTKCARRRRIGPEKGEDRWMRRY